MSKRKKQKDTAPVLRLSPQKRISPEFDAYSLKLPPSNQMGKMGAPVIDNCTQEHIM